MKLFPRMPFTSRQILQSQEFERLWIFLLKSLLPIPMKTCPAPVSDVASVPGPASAPRRRNSRLIPPCSAVPQSTPRLRPARAWPHEGRPQLAVALATLRSMKGAVVHDGLAEVAMHGRPPHWSGL